MHSVAVRALMIGLAKQLDLDDDATRQAGLGLGGQHVRR